MSNSFSAPGLCCAVALHAIALGALLFAGTGSEAVSQSDADPILLMLGGEDPNKDAGLVGRERGVARGTEDGTIPEPNNDTSRLDAIREKNERLAREEAEAEKRAAEEAAERAKAEAERKQREQAEAERRKAEQAAREKPKDKPKPGNAGRTKPKQETDGRNVNIRDIVKNNRDKGLYKNSGGNKPPRNGKGTRIGEIKIGGAGGGSVLGKPDGTGGNGGDGGKRVADERITYVNAVRERFNIHFENIVAQNPPSIPNSVSVNALFSVGRNGEIRFLKIEGNDNPQIRECIRKTFSRAFPSRFKRPPNGESFTGRLDDIGFIAR